MQKNVCSSVDELTVLPDLIAGLITRLLGEVLPSLDKSVYGPD